MRLGPFIMQLFHRRLITYIPSGDSARGQISCGYRAICMTWGELLRPRPYMLTDYFPTIMIYYPIIFWFTLFTYYTHLGWEWGHIRATRWIIRSCGVGRRHARVSNADCDWIGLKVGDRDHILSSGIQLHGHSRMTIEQLQLIGLKVHLSTQTLHGWPGKQQGSISLDHSGLDDTSSFSQANRHLNNFSGLLASTVSIAEEILLATCTWLSNPCRIPEVAKGLKGLGTYNRFATTRIQHGKSWAGHQHHWNLLHWGCSTVTKAQLFHQCQMIMQPSCADEVLVLHILHTTRSVCAANCSTALGSRCHLGSTLTSPMADTVASAAASLFLELFDLDSERPLCIMLLVELSWLLQFG